MKQSLLILLLSLLAPITAAAADPGATCEILIQSDPVKSPNSYDKVILTSALAPDEQTHYVLLSKDAKTASEISHDDYAKYKADKFKAIAGQYIVLYLQSEGLIAITYGQTDANNGTVIGGGTVYGVKSERTIVIPSGTGFGMDCAPIKP